MTDADYDIADHTIDDVLAYVDGDAALAAEARALEAERGDAARSTLIARLDEIIEPPSSEGSQDEDGRPPLAAVAVEVHLRNQPRPADVHGAPKED